MRRHTSLIRFLMPALLVMALVGMGFHLDGSRSPQPVTDSTRPDAERSDAEDPAPANIAKPDTTSGSVPPFAPTALLQPHAIRRASELSRLLAADPEGKDADLAISALLLMDYCSDPRLPRATGPTPDTIIAHAERKGPDARTRLTRATLARLCDTQLSLSPALQTLLGQEGILPDDLIPESDAAARLLQEVHEGTRDPGEALDVYMEMLAQAKGLFTYLSLATQASDGGLLARLPVSPEGPIQSEEAQAGVMLAACRLFGGCDAMSLLAITACFLSCETAMDVEALLMDGTAPRQLRRAHLVADHLVRDRTARRQRTADH